jgi:hypothetical protein
VRYGHFGHAVPYRNIYAELATEPAERPTLLSADLGTVATSAMSTALGPPDRPVDAGERTTRFASGEA